MYTLRAVIKEEENTIISRFLSRLSLKILLDNYTILFFKLFIFAISIIIIIVLFLLFIIINFIINNNFIIIIPKML